MTRRAAPYHFVPADPELAITDAPVFHDTQRTEEDFWSGELHCTLTALTPLLCANDQYAFGELPAEPRARLEDYRKKFSQERIDSRKHILEPLTLPLDAAGENADLPGPVLIPGTAIKGPIRQSLQALLSAPLERVRERTFSFRPNLKGAERMHPALVYQRIVQNNKLVGLKIEFCGRCDDLIYVYDDAMRVLRDWLIGRGYPAAVFSPDQPASDVPIADINAIVPGVTIDDRRWAKKLRSDAAGAAPLKNYALARYRGGTDGTFLFTEAFSGMARGYNWVLVKLQGEEPVLDALPTVPENVLYTYQATLGHIGDRESGLLVGHPLNRDSQLDDVPAHVKDMEERCPQPGDLILVEKANNKIIGIGHHFRYRWRYRDSIHQSHDPEKKEPNLRRLLRPLKAEQLEQSEKSPHVPPQKLSAARLLFGYVGTEQYNPRKPTAFGVGRGDFAQLSGRIALNWAVEQKADRRDRFLNAEPERACFVPLKPLGAPKPSAVEHYLTQERVHARKDQGILCTYGDSVDDPAGDLRGRKFYLHQPDAANDEKCYALSPDKPANGEPDLREHFAGQQAALARFVSRPNSEFRFTIRFRDLRGWELGALLFVLTADASLIETLAAAAQIQDAPALKRWLSKISAWRPKAAGGVPAPPNQGPPLLALKLGHGRPLGLGSVSVRVDQFRRLTFDPQNGLSRLESQNVEQVRTELAKRLGGKIRSELNAKTVEWAEKIFTPWLQVHRYAGRGRFSYPAKDGSQGTMIYHYHTDLRQKHAQGRQQAKKPGSTPIQPAGLPSLDELD